MGGAARTTRKEMGAGEKIKKGGASSPRRTTAIGGRARSQADGEGERRLYARDVIGSNMDIYH
jgi:hypothetical protein